MVLTKENKMKTFEDSRAEIFVMELTLQNGYKSRSDICCFKTGYFRRQSNHDNPQCNSNQGYFNAHNDGNDKGNTSDDIFGYTNVILKRSRMCFL